jgi:drug/metabolite transporter (DMT)-like permease
VSLLWGTSFAAAQIGLRELAPLHLVTLRFILASIVMALMLVSMKDNKIDSSDLPRFTILGFMAITSYFWIQYTALQYTTSIDAALIITTSPIATALLSVLFGGERLGWRGVLGIIIAFGGVVLVITKGNFSDLFQSKSIIGELLLLCNSLVWAGFTLYGKTVMKKYRPFVAVAYIHIIGTLMLLPAALVPGLFAAEPIWQAIAKITLPTVGAALYLALLCSVYAYYIWYVGIEAIGAVRTAVFSYMNPLFAIIAGLLFMGETLSPYVLVGGVFVIGGVYWINSAEGKQSDPTSENRSHHVTAHRSH